MKRLYWKWLRTLGMYVDYEVRTDICTLVYRTILAFIMSCLILCLGSFLVVCVLSPIVAAILYLFFDTNICLGNKHISSFVMAGLIVDVGCISAYLGYKFYTKIDNFLANIFEYIKSPFKYLNSKWCFEINIEISNEQDTERSKDI